MKALMAFLIFASASAFAEPAVQVAPSPTPSAVPSPEPAPPAREVETPSPYPRNYVEALGGIEIPTTSDGSPSSHFSYAGRVGTGIFSDRGGILSVGLFVGTISNSASVAGVSVDTRLTSLMLEILDRHVFGTGLYFGGRGGVAIESMNFSTATVSLGGTGVSAAFAPVGGYDFPLTAGLNFGIDASWITIGSGSVAIPASTTIQYPSASALLFYGGFAYHW